MTDPTDIKTKSNTMNSFIVINLTPQKNLRNHKLPNFKQNEINNLNGPITIKEINFSS